MSEQHVRFDIPAGMVEEVARVAFETMCEVAVITVSDGGCVSWDAIGEDVRDVWRAVARRSIATTLAGLNRPQERPWGL